MVLFSFLALALVLPALARDPLRDITTVFLTALTTRNPSLLEPFLAANATYSENTLSLPLFTGGLWGRASSSSSSSLGNGENENEKMVYRHSHVDFSTGQIATVTTLLDGDTPIIYTVRLRFNRRNEILEVETQVIPDPDGVREYNSKAKDYGVDRYGVWMDDDDETLSAGGAWRMERDRLVELAGAYYSHIDNSNGSKEVGFGKGCLRLENGREMPSCEIQSTPPLSRNGEKVVRERRFVFQGTDVQRQSVFSFAMVDDKKEKRTWYVAEGLRFNGLEKVDRIETTFVEVPFGSGGPF